MAEVAVAVAVEGALPLRLDTLLRRSGHKGLLQQPSRLTILRGAAVTQREREEAADRARVSERETVGVALGRQGDTGRTPGPATLIYPEDRVLVDGAPLVVPRRSNDSGALGSRTYALYKPRGMEVTMGESDLGRWLRSLDERHASGDTPRLEPGLSYVGRLDKQTSGLLLATNDGDFCSLVCESPHCEKVYVATVRCSSALEPT